MPKDEYKIRARLEKQISLLIEEIELHPNTFSWRERLSMVQIVGGYLIRQTKFGEEYGAAGSTIRKYSGAFRTGSANASSSRARGAGPPITVYSADDDGDDAS